MVSRVTGMVISLISKKFNYNFLRILAMNLIKKGYIKAFNICHGTNNYTNAANLCYHAKSFLLPSVYFILIGMMSEFNLQAVSPIDGRYSGQTSELKDYFSEFALMK